MTACQKVARNLDPSEEGTNEEALSFSLILVSALKNRNFMCISFEDPALFLLCSNQKTFEIDIVDYISFIGFAIGSAGAVDHLHMRLGIDWTLQPIFILLECHTFRFNSYRSDRQEKSAEPRQVPRSVLGTGLCAG